jgi:hypothetical protein
VLSFLVSNRTGQPIQTSGKIDIIHYGTRGITGDVWLPEVFKFEDLPALPVDVNIPANGSQIINVSPTLPGTFGAYAFVFDLGSQGRRFALSVVRTFAPAPKKIQYPVQSLDATNGIPMLKSLGIQAIRQETDYIPSDAPNRAAKVAEFDAKMKSFSDNNITVHLHFYVHPTDPDKTPLGRMRPMLDKDNNMLPNGNGDSAALPSVDADFQKYVTEVCKKYGWPNGPVTAVQLWNEPWEGISICNWGADMIRFRQLYTAMAQGVVEARKAGVEVMITGCDSSTNSWDKLFSDGRDDFLKWFDACSIHYQGLWSPALYKEWRNRISPYGRVKIWDTESWVANSEDRVSAVIAGYRAAGYDRTLGVFAGNITHEDQTKVKMPDGTIQQVHTYFPWPPAAAVATTQHFLGQREFKKLLFPNGLPWVMVFDGQDKNKEDGTIVVVGDLREAFNPDGLLFRNVKGLAQLKLADQKQALRKQIAALPPGLSMYNRDRVQLEGKLKGLDVLSGGSLTFDNPNGEAVLFDFYGNPIPTKDGKIVVPLDSHGFFLRGNGNPGAFDWLCKAVAGARIEGYEPLNVVAHDFTTPIEQKPSLRMTLTNILNRPITGSLDISLGDLKLNVPAKVEIQPNETKDVLIPIVDGTARPDNSYPLSFKFDAGTDGFAVLEEKLHVNVIAKRTITVDGNLDDWKGVLPYPVQASNDQGPSQALAAWLPMAKFDTSQKPGFATAYLAYDEKNFYFAAKIADTTPSPGTLRFANRNDDDFFYPDTTYDYDMSKLMWKKEVTWKEPARVAGALLLPGSSDKRSFVAWVQGIDRQGANFAVDFDLPPDRYRQVSFYFVDSDNEMLDSGPDFGTRVGRRGVVVSAQDPATGKILAQTIVRKYGSGCYATFQLAGKVRVAFRSASSLGSSLSGFFFDPVADSARKPNSHDTASAQFVAPLDTTTAGNWPAKYGHDGYYVFGSDPNYPAYAKVTVPEYHEKIAYHWPQGVRRFSYRQNPDLPFGSYPNFDNVQIAFNVIPEDQKEDLLPNLPGVMPGFIPYRDTDYEYALNKVAEAYGGGTEIWRCRVPGMPPKNFYPRQPASPFDGAVTDGKLAVTQDATTRTVEAAIPWSEIPLVKKAMDENKPIKFSFRVNDDKGPSMELPEGRSVSKQNTYAFHPDFVPHWANEVEFSFEK